MASRENDIRAPSFKGRREVFFRSVAPGEKKNAMDLSGGNGDYAQLMPKIAKKNRIDIVKTRFANVDASSKGGQIPVKGGLGGGSA